jgi:hypothetical protein
MFRPCYPPLFKDTHTYVHSYTHRPTYYVKAVTRQNNFCYPISRFISSSFPRLPISSVSGSEEGATPRNRLPYAGARTLSTEQVFEAATAGTKAERVMTRLYTYSYSLHIFVAKP